VVHFLLRVLELVGSSVGSLVQEEKLEDKGGSISRVRYSRVSRDGLWKKQEKSGKSVGTTAKI
jgi:hypothetical protein